MPEPIEVGSGVVVPGTALHWRAVRSSGPGGQNVNKVSSRVELRVDVAAIPGLAATALERLRALAGNRLGADGVLLVTSQRTRDQHRNLDDARTKVRELVARALVPPRPRRPTRSPASADRRRLLGKHRAAARKQARRRPSEDD